MIGTPKHPGSERTPEPSTRSTLAAAEASTKGNEKPQQSEVSSSAASIAPRTQVALNSQWAVRGNFAAPGTGIPVDMTATKATTLKQSGCSNWVEDSVTVTAMGEDSLFVNADVVSGIVDANGAPSITGQYVRLQYRADGKTPFYFGSGNSANQQLAPGQAVLIPVGDSMNSGNSEQHLIVRYCKP